ncbi:hypothetical protein AVEN_133655-1, partial [Araneus ventricosus]
VAKWQCLSFGTGGPEARNLILLKTHPPMHAKSDMGPTPFWKELVEGGASSGVDLVI